MTVQSIDHVALLPAYLAAATAVAAFLTDIVLPGRRGPVSVVTALGTVATGVAAVWVGLGATRRTFCTPAAQLPGGLRDQAQGAIDVATSCTYVADPAGAAVAVLFCALTLAVLGLSTPALRTLPPGEYCFLLACSLTGGVVLGYSRDLITLVIALETLTLPLYVLVGLRRRAVASAEGAVTFFVISVVSTAVTLLGAALLYALTGAVHLDRLATALASRDDLRAVPLTAAAVVLVLAGLAFKVAAVPFHAWAPAAYDGAPLPIAAYLSTASKLGGVVALLYVVVGALRPWLDVAGPVLAALAVATMTVGNLVALRQRRMVRLLAWSSVAQAGYLLAPLGAFAFVTGRTDAALTAAVAATIAYTAFYVLIELGAFGAVIALRGSSDDTDGGTLADYRGAGRRAPWLAGALTLALVGLAGLPPGLAGLFAKVTVVRSLLTGDAMWLAIIVALNVVVGLAYYVRVAATLYQSPGTAAAPARTAVPWPVAAALGAATAAAVVVGFAPQLILSAARWTDLTTNLLAR